MTRRGANTQLFFSRNRRLLSTTPFSILVRARRRLLHARPRVLYISPLSPALSVSLVRSPPRRAFLQCSLVFGVNDASWASLLTDQQREVSRNEVEYEEVSRLYTIHTIARGDRLAREEIAGKQSRDSSQSSTPRP